MEVLTTRMATHTEMPIAAAALESRAARTLREIFESGRPLVYIRSAEEERVARVLRQVAIALDAAPSAVFTWTLTEGLLGENLPETIRSAREVLDFIASYNAPAIFHLKDFHEPLHESAEVRRRLRDVYESSRGRRKFIAITSPVRAIPAEVERSLVYVELRPPDIVELAEFLHETSCRLMAVAARRRRSSSNSRALSGPDARRSALRAPARARCKPDWALRLARCSKRSGCW